MKKLKVLIKNKTNEIHWFFIGGFCGIAYKELLNTEFEFVDQNSKTFLKSSTCTKKDYFSKLEEIYKKLLENN